MKPLIIVISLFIMLTSCSKEEDAQPVNPAQNQYDLMPLSVGNYWVYETYTIQENKQEEKMSRLDCVYISKIVELENKLYYQFEGTNIVYQPKDPGILMQIRDSAGYIVDVNGLVRFTTRTFKDSLNVIYSTHEKDTFYTIVSRMEQKLKKIKVGAGNFLCLPYCDRIDVSFSVPSNVPNPRDRCVYFANHIGVVKESFFFASSLEEMEMRLLRYHIN